jgi:putative N6-adenine-specific DNA methylase
MNDCPAWSFFLITSDKEIEKDIMKKTGRKADRRRKLYNGTIETQFYQYHGERPPRNQLKGGQGD